MRDLAARGIVEIGRGSWIRQHPLRNDFTQMSVHRLRSVLSPISERDLAWLAVLDSQGKRQNTPLAQAHMLWCGQHIVRHQLRQQHPSAHTPTADLYCSQPTGGAPYL